MGLSTEYLTKVPFWWNSEYEKDSTDPAVKQA
jgi:hypothetical protein